MSRDTREEMLAVTGLPTKVRKPEENRQRYGIADLDSFLKAL